MKKGVLITLIAAASVTVIGAAMLFAALMIGKFDTGSFGRSDFEDKTIEISDSFDSISADVASYDLIFVRSGDGQCRIEYRGNDKIFVAAEVKNGRLEIGQKDQRRWYEKTMFFTSSWKSTKATILLPEDKYGAIYAKAVSGDIDIPDGFTFSDAELISTSGNIVFNAATENGFEAKTTSGDVRVASAAGKNVKLISTSGDTELLSVTAGTLEMRSTSGNVRLKNAQIDSDAVFKTVSGDIGIGNSGFGSLSVQTTSGDQELTDVTVDGAAEYHTTSGKIKLSSVISLEKTQIGSVSGDIEFKSADAGSFYIKTVSGDVKGDILTPKFYSVKTTSGRVSTPSSDRGAGECEITTTSGDVSIG